MNVCRQGKLRSETRLGESDSFVVNHGCVCYLVVRITKTGHFFPSVQERRLIAGFESSRNFG